MPRLTVVILTRDEALHIPRALASVRDIADHVLVVDSGSTDDTVALAEAAGAQVLHNPWVNYATQMNWGIDHVPADTDWILRLDADEVVTPDLAREIADRLPRIGAATDGIFVGRRMCFMGKPIRWGGLFPIRVLRIFRAGRGRCESRWMDEHIQVPGPTEDLKGEIVDDNRKSLTWWTDKHNSYASREVVDILNLEHRFMQAETIANLRGGQAGLKRWIKERVYARLPGGSRAFAYFLYRYLLRLGFLDGRRGAAFHVLQGFWYRYLVDAKLGEVRRHMTETGQDAETAIREVLGIDITTASPATPGETSPASEKA